MAGFSAGFSPIQVRALRLMKRRFRPIAVERALGLTVGDVYRWRAKAKAAGWTFPTLPKNTYPLSAAEYAATCRAAGVKTQANVLDELQRRPATSAWPHLVTWPDPEPPRDAAAGRHAARIAKAASRLRYVPASQAGGGTRHFERECLEHLARLIAYAPGPRYPDDPRAALPEPRLRPELPPPASFMSCALAQIARGAA